ncbi:hypothetical protein D3C76_1709500 [compost metagenome]
MIIANKAPGIAGLSEADFVAPVRAGIEKDLDRGILLTHHQNFVLTHRGGQVVPGLG